MKYYSVVDNILFVFNYLFDKAKYRYLVLIVITICLNVLTELSLLLFPVFVIKLYIFDVQMLKLCFYVSLFLVIVHLIKIINRRLESNFENYIDMRRLEKCVDYYEFMMYTDYVNLDSSQKREEFSAGLDSFYDDYHKGFSHIIFDARNVVKGVLALIVYSLFIARINFAIVLILVIFSCLSLYANAQHKQWLKQNIKNWTRIDMELKELGRQATSLNYAKDIRLYAIKSWLSDKYSYLLNERNSWQKREMKSQFKVKLFQRLSILIKSLGIYCALYLQLLKGLSVTEFLTVTSLVIGVDYMINQVFDHIIFLQNNNVLINLTRQVIDSEDFKQREQEISFNDSCEVQEIKFDNVSFSYGDGLPKVIDNLSFELKKGQKLALVGKNGEGKSTIVKLMCGLYRPTEGEIYINKRPIGHYSKQELISMFAVVFQDTQLLAFSIAENIACKLPAEIDDNKINEVLKSLDLYDKVMSFKDGVQSIMTTEFEEDGIVLSGGEEQKLMLARMLYKDSPVFILDEPTSALDPLAEAQLYEYYSAFLKDKSSLFISHRLSSTQFCDNIILLKSGKIIEQGTHQELLSLKGQYYTMFQRQAAYY